MTFFSETQCSNEISSVTSIVVVKAAVARIRDYIIRPIIQLGPLRSSTELNEKRKDVTPKPTDVTRHRVRSDPRAIPQGLQCSRKRVRQLKNT